VALLHQGFDNEVRWFDGEKIFIYNIVMQIPPRVQALLWDVSIDLSSVDARCERLIIERVMDRGCWEDMRWLLRSFDGKRLRKFVRSRGRRVLAPRELRFWTTVCGVPKAEADIWVGEARKHERSWRG
jgi:hypothetical protein